FLQSLLDLYRKVVLDDLLRSTDELKLRDPSQQDPFARAHSDLGEDLVRWLTDCLRDLLRNLLGWVDPVVLEIHPHLAGDPDLLSRYCLCAEPVLDAVL